MILNNRWELKKRRKLHQRRMQLKKSMKVQVAAPKRKRRKLKQRCKLKTKKTKPTAHFLVEKRTNLRKQMDFLEEKSMNL